MIGQGDVPDPLVLRTAWTLLHFLWQGAAVWVIAATVLRLLSGLSANVRYLAACAGLVVMASLPLVTFMALDAPARATPGAEARSEPGFGHGGHGELPLDVVEVASPSVSFVSPAAAVTSPRQVATRRDERSDRHYEATMAWLVRGWLMGVLLLSLRLLRGWLRIHRLKTRGAAPVGDAWQQKLAELANLMGVDRAVQMLRCATAEVPSVVGWLRPAILVPASVLTGLAPADLEAILLHELAHIRRHDYAVNLLQTVVETLLFYHPGVWWLSRAIRIEREHCCDDLAVSVHRDRVGYARALARLAESSYLGDRLAPAAGGGRLFDRIRRLVGHPVDRGRGPAVWGASAAVLGVIAVAVCGHLLIAADRGESRSDRGGEQRPGSAAGPAELYTPTALLQRIVESEEEIRDWRVQAVLYTPEEEGRVKVYDYEWGYSFGREFRSGTVYRRPRRYPRRQTMAFDGDKVRSLYETPVTDPDGTRRPPEAHEQGPFRGSVDDIAPHHFRGMATPRVLLGDELGSGFGTLGRALCGAGSVTVREEWGVVDGRRCVVLEVVRMRPSAGGGSNDGLVWIDPERGYRALRYEKYVSIEPPRRWKYILLRVDNVKLTLSDGIWFPTEGEVQFFGLKRRWPSSSEPHRAKPPKEELAKLSFRERLARGYVEAESSPLSVGKRLLVLPPERIRLNQGIPDEAFGLTFPKGTPVRGMGTGGGGGGMGGGGRRRPRREISQMVRKMAFLQDKGELALEPAQAEALAPVLTQLQEAEKLSDEEAEAPLASIKEVLTEAQQAALDDVELPSRTPGGGGPPGGTGGDAAGTVPSGPAAGAAGGGAASAGTAVVSVLGGAAAAPTTQDMGFAATGGRVVMGMVGGDRRQAMRERMLAHPVIKRLYDAKLAGDPGLATDEEKQSEFFRSIFRELSPFVHDSSKEALGKLLAAVQKPAAGPEQ